METNDPVTVCTLNDPYQAETIRAGLRGEGIVCELNGACQGAFSDILNIGVLVRARDADRACRIIRRHASPQKEHRGPGAM
jgi:hypothetical protein